MKFITDLLLKFLTSDYIGLFVRHALTYLSAYLVAHNILLPDEATTLVGYIFKIFLEFVPVIIALLSSVQNKKV